MGSSSQRLSSRQKACDRCVAGKRRCDNKAPCTRCARRGLRCSLATVSTSKDAILEQFFDTAYEIVESGDPFAVDSMSSTSITSGLLTSKNQGVNWPIDVWRVNELQPPTQVRLPPSYLNTMVRRLQSCIKSMADEAQTPFMRTLPGQEVCGNSAFDDAVVACTVYLNRNRHNQVSLNRTLARSYMSLIHKLKACLRPEEVLPTTQAVVVFEIMFLLGEDQRLCDLAVSCSKVVTDAVAALNQWLITELSFPSTYIDDVTTSDPEHNYDRWVMLESARRTILAYWFLQAAYRHLRDGYCELCPLLVTLPLSVNGDLWAASDERAWRSIAQAEDRSTTILPYLEATDWWMSTNFEHMDNFQIMLFETCKTIPARPFRAMEMSIVL